MFSCTFQIFGIKYFKMFGSFIEIYLKKNHVCLYNLFITFYLLISNPKDLLMRYF